MMPAGKQHALQQPTPTLLHEGRNDHSEKSHDMGYGTGQACDVVCSIDFLKMHACSRPTFDSISVHPRPL